MTHLRSIRIPGRSSASPSNITSAPDLTWDLIGTGKEHLLHELETFYWDGVKAELENILRTLKVWQQPEFANVSIDDDIDDHVHGFDTFIDQVSQEARAFAIRYGERRFSGCLPILPRLTLCREFKSSPAKSNQVE